MQVTELANEGLKRGYAVTVPAAQIAAGRDQRLAAVAKDLKMPGFRPGKVPMAIVKQRYGAAVMSEVLEQLVQETMGKLLADRGLKPAMQPKIEVTKFEDGADLEFKMDLEVLPEITLPDFAAIELERPKAEPAEAEIEGTLKKIAARNRKLEDVAEARPAAKGEVLVCDFTGSIDGVEFEGGKAQDMQIEVAGEGFIPGFTEQLEGMQAGETKVIDVTFPAEYGAAELAGKAAKFEIVAKALKAPVDAPMDDEFAKGLGMESLEKLREEIKTSLQREYDGLSRMKVKRALLDALAAKADFPVPQGMVDGEFEQIWQRVEADLKAGRLDEDDKGKDEETLKADYRAIAERRIRLGLLLSEIGRTNNIQVSAEELRRAAFQEAMKYRDQFKQVLDFFEKNPQAQDSLRAPIFEEKVVDFMLELAKVTDKTVTAEELATVAAA